METATTAETVENKKTIPTHCHSRSGANKCTAIRGRCCVDDDDDDVICSYVYGLRHSTTVCNRAPRKLLVEQCTIILKLVTLRAVLFLWAKCDVHAKLVLYKKGVNPLDQR